MLPVLEFHGIIAILISVTIICIRINYCLKMYNKNFIIEILLLALLTSFIWFCYGVYRKNKQLIYQFIITILVYSTLIILISKYFNVKHHV